MVFAFGFVLFRGGFDSVCVGFFAMAFDGFSIVWLFDGLSMAFCDGFRWLVDGFRDGSFGGFFAMVFRDGSLVFSRGLFARAFLGFGFSMAFR